MSKPSKKFTQAIVIVFAAWIISIGIIYIKAWVGPTSSPAAGSGAIAVDGSGNVGIGTTSPNEKLTVEGALSLDKTTAPSATTGYGKLYYSDPFNGLFGDSSDSAHTIIVVADTVLSSAESKFGGGSIYLDGAGDYLKILSSSDWNFGTGDNTIDFWFKSDGSYTTASRYIFTLGNEIHMYFNEGFGAHVAFYPIASTISGGGGDGTYTDGVWHHFAAVRSGSTVTAYIDGVSIGSQAASGSLNTGEIKIGAHSGGGYNFLGWIDEVRVSNVARWTTGFAPPTSAYTADSNTKLLIHADSGGLFFQNESGLITKIDG